jgi:hypothetical protein
MDVIIIFNGLGNQMSQYAFYLQKKEISKTSRFLFSMKSQKIHNGYELDSVFGITYSHSFFNKLLYLIFKALSYRKMPLISKPFSRVLNFLGFALIEEGDHYDFKPEYLEHSKGIKFYVGGWHSEKYFQGIREKVLRTFQFNLEKVGTENMEVLSRIKKTTSVSVHVRRGDFLDANNYNKFGAVCTLNYFVRAIEKMRSLIENPHFFFFTNDVEWVTNNFNQSDFEIININSAGNSWMDMFLISNCQHHINSNGSFSWWSSWLNAYENKIVIVPKNFMVDQYFEDIYPQDWIKLSDY